MSFDSINYPDMIVTSILLLILAVLYIQLQITINKYSYTSYSLEISTINYMRCVSNIEPVATNVTNDVITLCPIVRVNDGVVSIEVKVG